MENALGMDNHTVYTIGHSTHSLDTFIGLLKAHGITAVADVRSSPKSRTAHFNQDVLSQALKGQGIDYVFLGGELGARREEAECYEENRVDFAKVAKLAAFQSGLDRIKNGIKRYRAAIMCAEKEPLDCHRTVLVGRALQARGIGIKHILADGSVEDNSDTERRLLQMENMDGALFESLESPRELLDKAYAQRGKKIAYCRPDAGEHLPGPKAEPKMTLFTMGFAGKPAEVFFRKLQQAGVRRLVDVRLNNVSQLAGFTKKQDIEFFLREIAGIAYVHRPGLAPTKEILDDYKKKRIDWPEYERRFNDLLNERRPEEQLKQEEFGSACLLCSEPKADKCHRRLAAEYLAQKWGNVEIRHI